ncbi:MAG: Crp/Fnr family transcriptional regulator [Bacteroidota bacterium]
MRRNITVKKGAVLQREGELNSKIYVVQSGLLRSYAIDRKGKEHILMFAPEGWILADHVPPNALSELFIDALEETVVTILEKDKEDNPNVAKMLRRFNVLQKRILLLISASAIERYDHFVETYPSIVQRVPQRMIASYLGITPEALSKAKGKRRKKI